MNFKRFATYMVALSVIALIVWACQKYEGRDLNPKPKLEVSLPLLAPDSVAQLASNPLFITYFNALNFQFFQIRSITETMTLTQVDTYFETLDSLSAVFWADSLSTSKRDVLVQQMGYSSSSAYDAKKSDFANARYNLFSNSLFNGMTTIQKESFIEKAIVYKIDNLGLADDRGKGWAPIHSGGTFEGCLNQVIADYNKCMSFSYLHKKVADGCEIASWNQQNACCCLYGESCCSSSN